MVLERPWYPTGKMLPVRHQGGCVRAEQPPEVGCVILRGVEVDVIGHCDRQMHCHRINGKHLHSSLFR